MTTPEPKRISPAEALALMHEGYVYLDVRTEDEFADGHPEGSVNMPFAAGADAFTHEDFAEAVEARFGLDARLCIGCRSGVRSLVAARVLLGHGFATVVELRTGFDGARGTFGELTEPGWRRLGLPCSTGS
jgi:rhodanese-related sulfurtransferase